MAVANQARQLLASLKGGAPPKKGAIVELLREARKAPEVQGAARCAELCAELTKDRAAYGKTPEHPREATSLLISTLAQSEGAETAADALKRHRYLGLVMTRGAIQRTLSAAAREGSASAAEQAVKMAKESGAKLKQRGFHDAALAFARAGQIERALQVVESARVPRRAFLSIAHIAADQGRASEAKRSAEQALADKGMAGARRAMAKALLVLGDGEGAAEYAGNHPEWLTEWVSTAGLAGMLDEEGQGRLREGLEGLKEAALPALDVESFLNPSSSEE